MPDATFINKELRRYGNNPFDEPLWRLVWSTDQTEKRFGQFNEFYGSIFLRSFTGVRECHKYPHIINKWVIERWFGPEHTHPDTADRSRGSYEPIYVFADKDNNSLPLNMRVCEIVVDSWENRPSPTARKAQLAKYFEEQERREDSLAADAADVSRMATLLHFGSATGYRKGSNAPSKQRRFNLST